MSRKVSVRTKPAGKGNEKDMTNVEHLNLLLAGLAAGDSLGSTSEFISQEAIPGVYAKYRDQGWPFRQVGGGSFDCRPGQPTDDTDMAMCLVRSWRELGRFDPQDVAMRFVRWSESDPPDIGLTTRWGLQRIAEGLPWHDAARQSRQSSAANGSLMRNGVVAGMAGDLDEAFRISLCQGLMTHYAPLPQLCCAAQTWLLWRLLEGRNPFASDWLADFQARFTVWLRDTDDEACRQWQRNIAYALPDAWENMFEATWTIEDFSPFRTDFLGRDGYCLLTLQIAVWAVQWSLREEGEFPIPSGFPVEVFRRRGPWVLGWVAMVGHDADTYGAVAGPLIAAAHGGLPEDLTDGLWVFQG